MLPDFAFKQIYTYIGQAVGGPLWAGIAGEAAAVATNGNNL
jgi:hypothetical protein